MAKFKGVFNFFREADDVWLTLLFIFLVVNYLYVYVLYPDNQYSVATKEYQQEKKDARNKYYESIGVKPVHRQV